MQKHNLDEIDKNGFPINNKGEQAPLFDGDGNAILSLNNNILMTFPKNSVIKFDPQNKIESRRALDVLVNVLTDKFDEHLKGEISLDLTDETKIKHKVFTKEPLTIPTVQIYFSCINHWLNYLGNCYNIEFKLVFYAKYKEKIKNNFIALKTGLNKHHIKKNYLKFAKNWIKETDKNIDLEKLLAKNINEKKILQKNEPQNNLEQNDEINAHHNEIVDDKIWIEREEIERLKLKNHHVNFNFTVGTNGFHQVKINNKLVKIYTLELAQILCAENLNAEIITKGKKSKKIVITDWKYLNSYKVGYFEGQKYFEKTYTKSNIEDIRIKYNKDWSFAKNGFPLTFSQKRAKEYGYASGIISKIEDLQNEYPSLFLDFFKTRKHSTSSNLSEKILLMEKNESDTNLHDITEELLKSIWLPQARISVRDFLELGISKHIWNKDFKIVTQKGSLFGTGKTLLGSLSIALKGFAISQNTDYKETGKVFCKAFNIKINETTKEPYKAFGVGNAKLIRELKREFSIR